MAGGGFGATAKRQARAISSSEPSSQVGQSAVLRPECDGASGKVGVTGAAHSREAHPVLTADEVVELTGDAKSVTQLDLP